MLCRVPLHHGGNFSTLLASAMKRYSGDFKNTFYLSIKHTSIDGDKFRCNDMINMMQRTTRKVVTPSFYAH